MADEKIEVVEEQKSATKKKKERLFKNPKFVKILKYAIYAVGTVGASTVAYFIGKKNGGNGAAAALPAAVEVEPTSDQIIE